MEPLQRNMRSMVELDSLAVLENLVSLGLVGDKRTRSNKSAIMNKSKNEMEKRDPISNL